MTDLAREISASLAAAGLVPGPASSIIPATYLDSEKAPVPLRVSFGDKAVRLGNLFRAGECKAEPRVEIDGAGPGRYVLMMVDPDAPTPDEPVYAFWRHWVVVLGGRGRREGAQEEQDETRGGEGDVVVTRYLGPGPKDDSKPHRYLFLLFEQADSGEREEALRAGEAGGEEFVQRRSFDIGEFVRRRGLRVVGVEWMRCVGDGWEGEA